jgi:hypothetical protein
VGGVSEADLFAESHIWSLSSPAAVSAPMATWYSRLHSWRREMGSSPASRGADTLGEIGIARLAAEALLGLLGVPGEGGGCPPPPPAPRDPNRGSPPGATTATSTVSREPTPRENITAGGSQRWISPPVR